MNVNRAEQMEIFKPSIFSELSAYKKKKLAQGETIIDLSIGSPDLPPPSFIRNELSNGAKREDHYGYTLCGTNAFHKAVAHYYQRRNQVRIDADKEVLLLMGSQDGLVHLPMVFANPGDIILLPDPGYPAYDTGVQMAGAKPFYLPLLAENNFLPDLSLIPTAIAKKAKMMFLNFPGNPIPSMATEKFFHDVVSFAKKHHIIVVHDFAYSELYFNHKKPISFLSIPGAKEVGVEINSLSKSFHLAGARIGYMLGNEYIIEHFRQFKSNLDYGVFLPIQQAAITALTKGDAFCEQNREVYQKRRDLLVDGLREVGWEVERPDAGMFIWGKIPPGWKSTTFAYELIEKANVVVTPGSAFGPSGEGYVRMALVVDEKEIQQLIANLHTSSIF